jgi:soluble lytic murein transglycosylase
MKYFGNSNIWISSLISIGFILPFTEKISSDLNGISPSYLKEWRFQDSVFSKRADRRKKEKLKYKNKVKNQIRKIASNYQTDLKFDKLEKVSEYIFEYSQKYGYDPLFLTALIITESSFNNQAKSHRGAIGLMQILPTTGSALASETQMNWNGKNTLYDPEINIALGAFYLDKLLKRFRDLRLALEAYNHGPTKLRHYLKKGIRPKKYSNKVYKNYNMIKARSI